MADKSAIEWTDATWTPIRARNRATGKVGWHCEHDSEGCRFCYAEGMNKRLGTGLDFKPGHCADIELFLDEKMLLAPLSWKKPRMIFVCSMTDAFAKFVTDEMLDKMFAVAALCPQHILQFLTKRHARMRKYLTREARERISVHMYAISKLRTDHIRAWPLPNVWLGVSCEDQENADARIPDLLATPAAVRFVSAEPLLGPIDFSTIDVDGYNEVLPLGAKWLDREEEEEWPRLDWIIVGGESGPKARPMHPDWARSIRDQCAAADVPFFFKQWGEHAPIFCFGDGAGDWGWGDVPEFEGFDRVGKKAAGRLLDGVTHDAMPKGGNGQSAVANRLPSADMPTAAE